MFLTVIINYECLIFMHTFIIHQLFYNFVCITESNKRSKIVVINNLLTLNLNTLNSKLMSCVEHIFITILN